MQDTTQQESLRGAEALSGTVRRIGPRVRGGCQRLEQADRVARNEIIISPTKLHRKR